MGNIAYITTTMYNHTHTHTYTYQNNKWINRTQSTHIQSERDDRYIYINKNKNHKIYIDDTVQL